MNISRLALDDFRSWQQCVIDFAPGLNVLVGHNGVGKTNIVEAVEVLATGSSHRVSSSLPLVRRGAGKATIRANVDGHTYEMTIPVRGANRARVDGGKSLYYRDIAGRVRCVIFSPRDQALVSGDPSGRRSFVNAAAAQLVPGYYAMAQELTRVGRQRAALLKMLGKQEGTHDAGFGVDLPDPTLASLEAWTSQFVGLGIAVTRARARVVSMLAEPFARTYRKLAGHDEDIALTYQPSLAEVTEEDAADGVPSSGTDVDSRIRSRIGEHFQRIYPGEVARGANLIGPHRDDLVITLDGVPAKEFASNGEIWTMALALRMAMFQVFSAMAGAPDVDVAQEGQPILVLDDVFAQLDDERRRQIVDFTRQAGQTLITVASAGDVPDGIEAHMIDVEDIARRDGDVFAALGLPGIPAPDAVGVAGVAQAGVTGDTEGGHA